MNKFMEILIGLVFLVVPIYAWIVNFSGFGTAALVVLKGAVMWGLILIGVLFLVLGISDLRE
jgi:hypothetical protein